MITPKLFIEGNFTADDLVVSVSPSNLVLLDSVKDDIEKIWERKMKQAQEKGLHLYNGTSYRLNSLKEEDGKIHLDFGIVDYKTRYSLRDALPKVQFDERMYRNGCYVGATVKTSDDKYLMVKLSGKSMNRNTHDLLGGIMETNIPIDSDYVFKVLRAELFEEAGINESEIVSMVLRAMYQDMYTNAAFYLEVELSVSSTEIQERFNQNSDVDIAAIEVYTYDDYLRALQNHKEKQIVTAVFTNK